MFTAIYNDVVIDHFDHPRNPVEGSGDARFPAGPGKGHISSESGEGCIPSESGEGRIPAGSGQSHISGAGGSVDSGVWIEFRLGLDNKQIQNARFRAYGCPHTVALASWLTERLVGETLYDRYTLDKQEIVSLLDLPTEKMRSILVAEDALRACAAKLDLKED